MNDIVILNFSGVYLEETFYRKEHFRLIDCSDIGGTDCLCDSQAADQIRKRMTHVQPQGIHFIDSGDYHYVSKFLTDKIREDFTLVLIDHHTDLQPSRFEGMLTCGSWVKDALDTNPHLKKVLLIGVSDKLLGQVDDKYKERIVSFSESQIEDRRHWINFKNIHLNTPIYISLDKDVLSINEERTTWDQGNASLSDIQEIVSSLLDHERIIGVDICGECAYSIRGLLDKDLRNDDIINMKLLGFLETYSQMAVEKK